MTTLGSVTGTLATAGPLSGTGGGNAKISQRLVDYLERHEGSATYLVAVNGSVDRGALHPPERQAGHGNGWFTDTDPVPTVTEFERLVATGRVHEVYIPKGTGTLGTGTTSTEAVDAWVEKHGTVVAAATYGGGGRP